METIKSVLSYLTWTMSISSVCEIILLTLVIYLLLRKPTNTQSGRLIKGILVIAILLFFAYLAKLHTMVFAFRSLLPMTVLILVVIFQPEIRRGLSHLGRMKLFNFGAAAEKYNLDNTANDINQIILAVKELAENKFGALLVIEPVDTEQIYLSPGTQVNADISANLILSICFPKSPLHDGAIIIQQGKIKAASVILPITDQRSLSHIYGTRHRAAIGLSEIFDCLCILVSEETGSICTAYHGNFQHFSEAKDLSDCLKQFYNTEKGQSSSPKLLSYSPALQSENSLNTPNPAPDA